jgi:hypothetical protein
MAWRQGVGPACRGQSRRQRWVARRGPLPAPAAGAYQLAAVHECAAADLLRDHVPQRAEGGVEQEDEAGARLEVLLHVADLGGRGGGCGSGREGSGGMMRRGWGAGAGRAGLLAGTKGAAPPPRTIPPSIPRKARHRPVPRAHLGHVAHAAALQHLPPVAHEVVERAVGRLVDARGAGLAALLGRGCHLKRGMGAG